MTVAGIVLAAGDGSRLGGCAKALLPHRGRPLLHTVTDALRGGGCGEIVVVVGAYGDAVAAACDATITVVTNPEWAEGMSTSLRVGIDAAGNRDTVAVTVVDFPGITSGLVHAVLSAHERGSVTLPVFDGRPGHPVVFDHVDAVAAAARATGDEGARAFLAEHGDRIHRVDCTALADAADIDTPRDLYRLTLPRNG